MGWLSVLTPEKPCFNASVGVQISNWFSHVDRQIIGRSSADPTYHYWLIDTTKEATCATWDALTPQW